MTKISTTDTAAAVLRISSGVLFLAHVLLKVNVFTVAGTVGYFESLGLPGLFAYATLVAELGGGLALLLGIASRWVALALIPLLAGTVVLVHGANGWLFANPGGGWEYPVFLMAASATQALLGDGAYALRWPNRDFHRPVPA